MKTRLLSFHFLLGTVMFVLSLFGIGCATVMSRVCEVHGVPMTRETVIAGGFPIESSEHLSARKGFPHDGHVRGGGCLMLVATKTYICPDCKEASENW